DVVTSLAHSPSGKDVVLWRNVNETVRASGPESSAHFLKLDEVLSLPGRRARHLRADEPQRPPGTACSWLWHLTGICLVSSWAWYSAQAMKPGDRAPPGQRP